MRLSRRLLLSNVVIRETPVGERPAGVDHVSVYVEAVVVVAGGDDSAVAVHVYLFTPHLNAHREVFQSASSDFATWVSLALHDALLGALERINAVKPDSLARDLNSVAVDDRGRAGDVREGEGRKQKADIG